MPFRSLSSDRAALGGVTTGVVFAGRHRGDSRPQRRPTRPGSDARRSAASSRATARGPHQRRRAARLGRDAGAVHGVGGQLAGSAGRGSRAAAGRRRDRRRDRGGVPRRLGLHDRRPHQEGGRDDGQTVALHRRAFLSGGVVHGAGFRPARRSPRRRRRAHRSPLPRGVATAALASGAAGLLTPLYLLAEPAAWPSRSEVLRPGPQRVRRSHGPRAALSRGTLTRCDGCTPRIRAQGGAASG